MHIVRGRLLSKNTNFFVITKYNYYSCTLIDKSVKYYQKNTLFKTIQYCKETQQFIKILITYLYLNNFQDSRKHFLTSDIYPTYYLFIIDNRLGWSLSICIIWVKLILEFERISVFT